MELYEMTHPIASAISDIVKTIEEQRVIGVWRKRGKYVTVDSKAYFVTQYWSSAKYFLLTNRYR